MKIRLRKTALKVWFDRRKESKVLAVLSEFFPQALPKSLTREVMMSGNYDIVEHVGYCITTHALAASGAHA